MPITTEAIRRITIQATSQGVDQAAAGLNNLAAAQGKVATASSNTAVVTDIATKRQLSAAEAYRRQTLVLDDQARAQSQVARATKTADAALAQGVITQDEYAKRLALINQHYSRASAANDNFAKSAGLAKHELVNLSRQVQDIGVSLSSGQSPFTVLVQQGTQVADIFANSGGTVRGFAGQLTSLVTPMRAVTVGVIALGVAALAALVSWRSFGLQLDDTARQAGVASTEMAKLQAAGSFKGIGTDDFAKASGEFSRNVYDAKNNMGGLAEVFRANNMQAKDFNGSLEQAADLIRNAASDQQRLVLLQQMGLPATMQWVRFMSQGADGIREAKKQAVEFGGAANDNMIAKAREFDEAWNKFTTNFGLRWRGALLEGVGLFDRFLDRVKFGYLSVAPETTKRTIFNMSSGSRLTQADANAFYGAVPGFPATGPSGPKPIDPSALKQQLSLEQQRISALGQLASVEDQVRSREIEVQTARLNGVKITRAQEQAILGLARATADGTLAMKAMADGFRIEAETIGLSIGKATELRLVREKELEAQRLGLSVSAQTRAAWAAEARLAGEAAQALEKARLASQIKFDRDTAFLSQEDVQIAQKLAQAYGNDVTAALNSSEAAAMRLNNALKSTADMAKDFALDLAKAALAGQNMGDALVASLDKVAGKLLDRSFQDALTALVTLDPAMAAKAGVEAAVAIGISLFTGESKKRKEEAEALEKAQAAWASMAKDFEAFSRTMRGSVIGSVQKEVDDARDKALEFFRAATKAGDTSGANRALEDFKIGAGRMVQEFQQQAGHIVNALNQGGGLDSPLLQAVTKTFEVAGQLKGFVSDATQYTAVASQAREAAQNFALSLLDMPKTFSETEQAIAKINGTATALTSVLADLGLSSEQAGKAINEHVAAALANLAKNFTDDLQRQLNEASGQGFVNELNDLIKRTAQQRSDAALLPNVDSSLIDRLFAAQAQKIVDQAGLVGSAFDDLLQTFPSLSGVVHESTAALEEQVEMQRRLAEEQARAARGIVDYINSLKTGPDSALSPTARLQAAQTTYDSILALAQQGNADALARITADFENLRKAAQGVFGSSTGYQNILNTGVSQLQGLPAVATSTDPIVQALLDVKTAVNSTTTAVGVNTGKVVDDTSASTVRLDATVNRLESTIYWLSNMFNVEAAIQGLQTTARDQLNFLASQITTSVSVQTLQGGQTRTTSNNFLTALNKIVVNTYAIAQNTFSSVEIANNAFSRSLGTLSGGGWITGGVAGKDSVLLASGNALGMPDEFVVRRDVAQANAAWLPQFNQTGRLPMPARWGAANDNSGVVAALGVIVSRLDRLERSLANVVNAGTSEQREGSRREIAELRRQTMHLDRSQRDASTRQNIARKTGTN